MKRFLAVLALVAACGGDSTTPPPVGSPKLGIESGNNQTTIASTPKLGAPVIGRMVRTSSGAARFVRRSGALLDGTVVTGSPIPGAVVCAVSLDAEHPLTAFTPCTNTDSTGHATFFFSTGTVAGVAQSAIRGTVGNEPAVFDTVTATVLPGLPDSSFKSTDRFDIDRSTSPARIFKNAVYDQYGNSVPFRITPDARLTPRDTVTGGDSSRYVSFVSVPADSGMHSTLLVGMNSTPLANLWYRIRDVNGIPTLGWLICGLKITCTVP